MYQVQTDNTEINAKNVENWINTFTTSILPERKKYGDYYDGKNAIVKQGAVENRPNYSINVNMAKYIIDVATAYTFGVPVTYKTDNEQQKAILDKLQYILKNCNANKVDFKQGGDMSTYGVSYQLILAPNENKSIFAKLRRQPKIEDRIRIKSLSPLQTFYVVDSTILENPVCAVYMYEYQENNVNKMRVYVYDNTFLYIFNGTGGTIGNLESKEPHNMGTIPVIQCMNNEDAYSDIQGVIDLLDSLSLCVSNNTDDLQSIANAILAASGGAFTEKQINEINTYKVANLPVGAKMEWVIKNINPEATKQQIDYLLNFIFQISQVPDLTDDAFGGNQSGVAMQYKLWGMDQLWITKTANYEEALYQRLRILLHLLQYQFDSNVALLDDITITFSKNLPTDTANIIDTVVKLKGIVSDDTLLAQIPFVEDVEAELDKLEKQAERDADLYGFNNNKELDNAEEEQE